MLKCHQEKARIIQQITQFTKGKSDMCQAEGCALVCKHKDKISQNYGKTITNICGTSLCMTC